ncbi:glucosyltransferase domain-containing protein [Lentibacillus cibarius]|uniref:Glycosyltransferase family 39 protein n=1 Tax=Lentibacillus cibarius TaxID=2583219 RepID=A0A5S3QIE2_9BACI|nr:glucosyltransferase domain-containing protein [Lentibacillus cibarius]TMN21635.1 hypothetical protein FFL34_05565 [Lentibacillus cibarius]
MPEEIFSKIKAGIKREWKIAFFSTVIIGFLTHMFVLTNMLPNHDGLVNIYSSQKKYALGRFFLGPFSGISSFFDLPWVNGTLSIFYLALTSILLTEFFKLRKTPAIILTAGLVVTFPTIASTFSYMFTADGYMFGFLLSVFAVFLTKKYRYGLFPAAFILYLSVGIYQANVTIVLTVVTVWFIQELISNHKQLKSILYSLMLQIGMTVLGMSMYAITFKGYQTWMGGEITKYQGLDQIGNQKKNIIEQILLIKDKTMEFFFRGFVTDFPINFFEVLNLLLILLILAGVAITVVLNKVYLSPVRMLFIVLSIVLLPIFSFVLYFVSPGVVYHMLMVMAVVLIYILPIVLYNRLDGLSPVVNWYSWGTVVVSCLIIFNFSLISNISYFNMSLKYEKSYAMVNRMLDRMEQTDGYTHASKLAVIGRTSVDTELGSKTIPENIPKMTGAMREVILFQPYHYTFMLENQMGKVLETVDAPKLKKLKESNLVKQMNTWPSKDSVKVKEDIIILKLDE